MRHGLSAALVIAGVGSVLVASAGGSAQDAAPVDSFDLAAALRGTAAPLTADDAAKRAVSVAPSVRKAVSAGERTQLAAAQAYLGVYPRFEVEGRYTRLSKVDLGAASAFLKQTLNNYLLEARLTYPVSALFFSILPRYRAAQKNADAQKLQAGVESQVIAMNAREAYYNYARARASLMVARSALAQAEAHRRDVDALVNAGTLARVELMRADAQVAAAKVAVSRIEGGVAIARVALYALLHLEGDDDLTITEDLEEALPALAENQDAILAKALAARSEIKALRLLADGHERNIDALQGDELPQLVVGGNVDYANPNTRYFSSGNAWNESWAAFAAISWSPNDWASSSKVVDQARADLAQTLADLEALERALRVEVAQAYEDFGAARGAMESARVGITAAEESYRVRREQFRAGAAVATDVIDAEAELRDARLQLVNAAIDMRIAKARLDRSVEAK